LLSTVESPGCEALSDGLLKEPLYAITSLAFVIAAAWILLAAGPSRSHSRPALRPQDTTRTRPRGGT
jgi:hypothetical protein